MASVDDRPAVESLFRLDGRVAVVTGASSGLGERFARVLHAAGAHVVVAARRVDRLDGLAASLGDRVLAVPTDVTDPTAREALVAAAVGLTGAVDVLVNNAGVGAPSPAEHESLEEFDRVMDVNVTSVLHLSQLAGRHMLAAGRGSIVNVASVLGLVSASPIKHVAYCTAKGAVVNMTRQLGCEWGRKGVRVNALAPGWFRSEMTAAEMFDDPDGRAFVERTTPMGRAGEASELDGALLFLAGDASTYVTGHVLAVDGGWLAR